MKILEKLKANKACPYTVHMKWNISHVLLEEIVQEQQQDELIWEKSEDSDLVPTACAVQIVDKPDDSDDKIVEIVGLEKASVIRKKEYLSAKVKYTVKKFKKTKSNEIVVPINGLPKFYADNLEFLGVEEIDIDEIDSNYVITFECTEEENDQIRKEFNTLYETIIDRDFKINKDFIKIVKKISKKSFFPLFKKAVVTSKKKKNTGISNKDFDMVIAKTNESKGSFTLRGTEESISKIITYLKAFYHELFPDFIINDFNEEHEEELPSTKFVKEVPFAEFIEYKTPSRIFKRNIIRQISEFNKTEGIYCRHEFEIPKIWIYSYEASHFESCVEEFNEMIDEEFSISVNEFFWKIQNKEILKYIKKEYKSEVEKIKQEVSVQIKFDFECEAPPQDATVFKVKSKAKSLFEEEDEWTFIKVTVESNKNTSENEYLDIEVL